MNYDAATRIRLDRLEKDLTKSIRNGELPFLGHYANFLYEKVMAAIHDELIEAPDPLWPFYFSLNRWPAVFSTYLTRYVAEGYGCQGTSAVYPSIEKAIHTKLSNSGKEKLWSTFRHSCLRLGLSVSPRRSGTNYMVDEYLRQSGVPLQYVAELAEKMFSYANEVGTPDDDDPSAIRLWQSGLKSKIRYLPQPVQKAILADDEGFYARLFIRLSERATVPGGDTPEIERLFAQKIQELKSRDDGRRGRKHALSIPQFVLREGQLGVELPPGDSSVWRIDIDDHAEDHFGALEKRFVPFSLPLPKKINVFQKNGAAHISKEIWPDEKNNRFLVFSATGGLVCKGQLGQAESILLEPGVYDLLLRFFPSDLEDQCEQLSDEPALVLYHLPLDPAQTFELVRGPAKAIFKADTKPAMEWVGQKYRGILGNELYASSGLQLEVKIPEDLYTEESADYELRLDPGGLGSEVVVPLPRQELNSVDFSLYLSNWKPGLSRLLVELRRQGFHRSEARSAIFCWNGLLQIKNRTRFICSELPPESNLLQGESDNLKIDQENKTVTFRNEDQRIFRMIFQLPGSRRQPFTWAVPGVFLQLIDYRDGQAVERPVKKGSTVSATTSSREVLEIFASSNGMIGLGALRKVVDFDRVGRVRLPVSGLVDYLGPGADMLRFTDSQSQLSEDLLRLVSPHQILEFRSKQKINTCTLHFSTKDEVEELSLHFKDLFTGWEKDISLSCNAPEVQGDSGFSAFLSCPPRASDAISRHELQFFLENWPSGAWFVTLSGKINGRWGRFSNTRNDHFAFGMIVVSNQAYKKAEVGWEYILQLDTEEKEKILKRIHRRLLNCYAPESWEQLEWLGHLWKMLVSHLTENRELSPKLIALAEERDEGGNNSGWIPMVSLAAKIPHLYSQLGRPYRELSNPRQLLSIKCLRVLGQMKYGILPLLNDGTLNNMLAFGFSNPGEIVAGKPARNFDLKRFEAVLKMEDVSDRLRLLRQHEWQPGEGDYLGSLHYRFALDQLRANFRASMSGNEYRRGKALSLCRNIGSMALPGAPQSLAGGQTFLNLDARVYDEEYVMPLEEEHIQLIAKFLSRYARACRWEVRKSGILEDVWNRARNHLGSQQDIELVLGYLLTLGKDVFLYYLLLWESVVKTDVDNLEARIYVRK